MSAPARSGRLESGRQTRDEFVALRDVRRGANVAVARIRPAGGDIGRDGPRDEFGIYASASPPEAAGENSESSRAAPSTSDATRVPSSRIGRPLMSLRCQQWTAAA